MTIEIKTTIPWLERNYPTWLEYANNRYYDIPDVRAFVDLINHAWLNEIPDPLVGFKRNGSIILKFKETGDEIIFNLEYQKINYNDDRVYPMIPENMEKTMLYIKLGFDNLKKKSQSSTSS